MNSESFSSGLDEDDSGFILSKLVFTSLLPVFLIWRSEIHRVENHVYSICTFKCSVYGVYGECRLQRLYLCEHHILECVELLNDSLWIHIGIISLFECEVLQIANLWYPILQT